MDKTVKEKKIIKYICFYDSFDNYNEQRNQSIAAHIKIDYIVSLFEKLGFSIEIISASQTQSSKSFGRKRCHLTNNCTLQLFKTIGNKNIISRFIRKIQGLADFKKYLKKTIKNTDIVIAYHSLEYSTLLAKLKRKIGFKLILEVEELYSTLNEKMKKKRQLEFALMDSADSFIFSNYKLNEYINKKGKPSIVVHGDYRGESLKKTAKEHNTNYHFNMVYVGSLDENRGVLSAVKALLDLPKEYSLRIVGTGTELQIKIIKQLKY